MDVGVVLDSAVADFDGYVVLSRLSRTRSSSLLLQVQVLPQY